MSVCDDQHFVSAVVLLDVKKRILLSGEEMMMLCLLLTGNPFPISDAK